MQQVDESKVKALESIFGGQDITASVIRTVLSSNDNKFDDAVDSLLNMTTSEEEASARKEPSQEELNEDALLDKKEREKIKTLENMFGSDLSNSVICTVLESNKGELVDTVDTLLNMTSKDLNPQYQAEARKPVDRESERLRQEEDIKSYEEFKRLQIKLQEEETRAIKEQQRKIEEEATRKSEEERRCVQEQDRILREYETVRVKKQAEEEAAKKKKAEEEAAKKKKTEEEAARKKAEEEEAARKKKTEEAARKKKQQAEEAARKKKKEDDEKKAVEQKALDARQVEETKALLANLELEKAKEALQEEERRLEQERLQRAWEQRLNSLKEAEEKMRISEAERKLVEDKRREELRLKEELLNKKAQDEELRLAKLREEEAKILEQKRLQFEEELLLADRRRKEESLRFQQEQLRKAEEEVFQRKLEEERVAEQMRQRIEYEREQLQKERAALEAAVRAQEEVERQKKLEAERIRTEEIAREEQRRREVEIQEQLRRAEEQRIKDDQAREEARKLQEEEEEKAREEAEAKKREQELIERQQEEEARERLQLAEEEAQRQEEELKAKEARQLAYDQMAASAVFIPPKAQVHEDNTITATVSGDTVTCNWDLPEGNAAPTNWLGLYPVRALAGTKKYTHFAYTNNTSTGQHIFRGVTPGQYEVRFFATRAYEHSARSAPVCVGPVATVMPQVQGDHVLVCYTLSPFSQAPKSDWLGVYEKDQRRNKLYLSTAYGNAEGQVMMKAPRTPGTYEVRLFASGSVYNEQAKAEFVIEDNDCVNAEPTSVMAGTNVNINWVLRTLEPSTADWVGLYRADESSNNNYLSCTYTNGAGVGTAAVQAPKEVGVYEFRLFAKAKGKYTTHRTSSPLIVV